MTIHRVHGHVRILRDLTADDWGDLAGLVCIILTAVQLLRLALP